MCTSKKDFLIKKQSALICNIIFQKKQGKTLNLHVLKKERYNECGLAFIILFPLD